MLLVASNPPAGTDTDAAAWKTAVLANSGTVSDATLKAVSDFCKAAKANNYWSKLLRINLFCGGQLAACLVPLKVGGGNSVETNYNFVSGDYSESTGLTSSASNRLLSTGFSPSSLTANDTHFCVYNRSSSIVYGYPHMVIGGGMALFAPFSDGKVYSDQYSINDNGRVNTSSAVGTPIGHIVASRTSSTSHVIYRNGSSVATNTATNSSTLGTGPLFVFGLSTSKSAQNNLAAYSIGSGLSSTDASNYYTDLQAFQTALGRNV